MHGIGHVIYGGKNQAKVIDYDNLVRGIHKTSDGNGGYRLSPLIPRQYDESHNKTVFTSSGTLKNQ